jgi:hypothetical protein
MQLSLNRLFSRSNLSLQNDVKLIKHPQFEKKKHWKQAVGTDCGKWNAAGENKTLKKCSC